jgi:hypothetical protein
MGTRMGWISLVLVFLGLFIRHMPAIASEEQVSTAFQLLQVMEKAGAEATEVEARTSVKLGNTDDPKELDRSLVEWEKRLGLPQTNGKGKWENGIYVHQNVTDLQGIRLFFRLIGVPKQGKYDAHVVLSFKGKPTQLQHIEWLQQRFSKELLSAGVNPQFSTCIRGMYSDKLSVDQQEGKILSIFRALQAYEMERLADETVVSISGYTRSWEPFIQLNGQKMNLQVATHQDTVSGGTWITVGTPIITAEY